MEARFSSWLSFAPLFPSAQETFHDLSQYPSIDFILRRTFIFLFIYNLMLFLLLIFDYYIFWITYLGKSMLGSILEFSTGLTTFISAFLNKQFFPYAFYLDDCDSIPA